MVVFPFCQISLLDNSFQCRPLNFAADLGLNILVTTMSFGFSVGDFLAVLQLANDLGGRFAQAPREYKAIKEEYVLKFWIVKSHINGLRQGRVSNFCAQPHQWP